MGRAVRGGESIAVGIRRCGWRLDPSSSRSAVLGPHLARRGAQAEQRGIGQRDGETGAECVKALECEFFVIDALEQGLPARQPARCDGVIYYANRGSQYVSIRYSERLAEAGIDRLVGSKGDSYDNRLVGTLHGLYKAKMIHKRTPWKSREAVEIATLKGMHSFNHPKLLEPICYIPPAVADTNYYSQLDLQANAVP